MSQEVTVTVVGLPPNDFERLWNTGTLAYQCRGCGKPTLDEEHWCSECRAVAGAQLKVWNAWAQGAIWIDPELYLERCDVCDELFDPEIEEWYGNDTGWVAHKRCTPPDEVPA
jgi:hypothetical protein